MYSTHSLKLDSKLCSITLTSVDSAQEEGRNHPDVESSIKRTPSVRPSTAEKVVFVVFFKHFCSRLR